MKSEKDTFEIHRESEINKLIWQFQCIDTMKTSRDKARVWGQRSDKEKLIKSEAEKIQKLGANCIAIDTPYDEEFIPYLSLWVKYARLYGLKIWYRGNVSGWEGWFDYKLLNSPFDHHLQIYKFITSNPKIFKKGDIFTPAPEPENGLIGDPRTSDKNKVEYLKFLFDSFENCQKAFLEIKVPVECGYFSTNEDIARDIFSPADIYKLGNNIVIDHYVSDPNKLGQDSKSLSLKYSVKTTIGEFGAPIPSINGNMDESEQADFVKAMLVSLYTNGNYVKGVNYWVIEGGTTALFNDDGTRRKAADIVEDFFRPGHILGKVTDELGRVIKGAEIRDGYGRTYQTNERGNFHITIPSGMTELEISSKGFNNSKTKINIFRNQTYFNIFILNSPLNSVIRRISALKLPR